MTSIRSFAAAGLVSILSAMPAAALPTKLKVTNHRGSPVLNLRLEEPGTKGDAKNLLKAPLAPGETVEVSFTPGKGKCVYNVRGVFQDGEPVQGDGLDICKDHNLTLVE